MQQAQNTIVHALELRPAITGWRAAFTGWAGTLVEVRGVRRNDDGGSCHVQDRLDMVELIISRY